MKKRDIGQEILEGIKAIKKGKGKKLYKSTNSSLKEALEIKEDVSLSLLAEKRDKTFSRVKALRHEEVW